MKILSVLIFVLAGIIIPPAPAPAQTVAFPATPITVPVTINGTVVNITFTIPAQTLACTGCGGSSGLPTGLTFSNGVFNVTGSIIASSTVTATQISLTGGPALPTCTTNTYVLSLTSGVLSPACLTLPGITVTQAASPANTITLTP